MKKFKKVIVALLAMVMVLGCLTVAASAAETDLKVTVKWAGAAGEDVSLWCWEDGGANFTGGNWPGKKMTKVDNETYEITIKVDAAKVCMIPSHASQGQTVDIKDIDTTKGDVTITIGEKGTDGKWTGTATYGTNANAGVSAPVAVAAIAVVSMVGIVVFSKRRTVAE